MPKLLNWDQYYDIIHERYVEEGLPLTTVREILQQDHGFTASERAFRERIRLWDFPNRQTKLHLDSRLVEKIQNLWRHNYSSKSMLMALNREGFPNLTKRQLTYVRHRNGIFLGRGNGNERKAKVQAHARSILEEGMKSGDTLRYGYVYASSYLRKQTGVFISEKDLREVVQQVDPKGVEDRKLRRLHKRGRYGVPGPNRVWSIDGHDKLARFGFEIYGCIDAYSRCIIWCYVGHSNRTAVSVLKQYLVTVQNAQKLPKLIRSDCGSETGLLARAHLALRRAEKPELEFQKIYSFGTSTRNQRIEAWWRLLQDGKTDTFRTIFEKLENDGLFNGGAIDVTSMQYIYMDIIRAAIQDFVQIHNTHRIRNQRQRELYLPTGRPYELYNHPPTGVQDYAQVPTPFVLEALLNEVQDYNLEEYLTIPTCSLCDQLMVRNNLPTKYTFADDHVRAYLVLRRELAEHFQKTGQSIELLPKPTGSMQWIEESLEVRKQMENFRQQVRGEEVSNQDFLLYQTDNESSDITSNYNKGREEQLAAAERYDTGKNGSRSDDDQIYDEEDDDGIVLLL